MESESREYWVREGSTGSEEENPELGMGSTKSWSGEHQVRGWVVLGQGTGSTRSRAGSTGSGGRGASGRGLGSITSGGEEH